MMLWGAAAWAQSAAKVEDTYWRVTAIDGKPVEAPPQGREPHLVLKTAGKRVHGSTGCNRFTGTYTLSGCCLEFKPLAVTKMACPPPLAAQEQSFLQAMAAIRHLRQSGSTLELLDDQGTVRLRLELKGRT